uniref:Uncharacterized protein n=1 Tax=Glossina austeni TaxID=7395 RepID=A0A1A9VGV5_GLOAU
MIEVTGANDISKIEVIVAATVKIQGGGLREANGIVPNVIGYGRLNYDVDHYLYIRLLKVMMPQCIKFVGGNGGISSCCVNVRDSLGLIGPTAIFAIVISDFFAPARGSWARKVTRFLNANLTFGSLTQAFEFKFPGAITVKAIFMS